MGMGRDVEGNQRVRREDERWGEKKRRSHTTGSGAHDNRPKRKRTRQAQRSAWQEEV